MTSFYLFLAVEYLKKNQESCFELVVDVDALSHRLYEAKMPVELGMLKAPDGLLESRFFPHKVGGKPAWLELKNIPDADSLRCRVCGKVVRFLCQIYCPIDDVVDTFHRTIFVFFCPRKECFEVNSSRNFIVLRNQLAKINQFYPHTPPLLQPSWRPDICAEKFGTQLCQVCGLKAASACGKCGMHYCSSDHHLCAECTTIELEFLFPEYALEIQEEQLESDYDSNSDSENDHTSTADLVSDPEECPDDKEMPPEWWALEQLSGKEDSQLREFRRRLEAGNGLCRQVMRYERGGVPLWITRHSTDAQSPFVPPCSRCTAPRTFELQIVPEMLNAIKLDAMEEIGNYSSPGILDWGTLVIYTCERSCSPNISQSAYIEEFIYKQDVV